MNQKTLKSLCFPLFHSYIIVILFSLLTRTTLCSTDPKFEACVPKTCGNNQTVSYPFYIKGKQEPFCGNPDFEITCGGGTNNGFPILTLFGSQYIIHEIDYNNHSLRVSNAAFSKSSSEQCIARTQNLTVGVNTFTFGSNRHDLLLFYGCDLTSLPERMKQSIIGCSAENKTGSVLGLDKEDPNLGLAVKNCYGGVVIATVEDERGGIEEALRRGFVLNWKASNCSECSNTGGRCGFDPDPATYAFRCYCPDRVHKVKCDPYPG